MYIDIDDQDGKMISDPYEDDDNDSKLLRR